jgi:hypothetical protein
MCAAKLPNIKVPEKTCPAFKLIRADGRTGRRGETKRRIFVADASKAVVLGLMCGRCSSFVAVLALIPSQALHGAHVCAVQNWDYKYESRVAYHSYRVLHPFSCLEHTHAYNAV